MRVIRKDISLDNIAIEEPSIIQKNKNSTIYALDKNYIIEPQKHPKFLEQKLNQYNSEYFYDIKSLIANSEYFEAAKKLISIDENSIALVFEGQDDYHYCSSIIYYNLGNMDEAYFNIEKISNKEIKDMDQSICKEGWIRILPHNDNLVKNKDGFFIACLKKVS